MCFSTVTVSYWFTMSSVKLGNACIFILPKSTVRAVQNEETGNCIIASK